MSGNAAKPDQAQYGCIRMPGCPAPLSIRPFMVLLPVTLFILLGAVTLNAAQGQAGRTRSPHGPLRIACENCHTSTSWIPLRPSPDFNHVETGFPLRGAHVSVACRQCHSKLVFTNVGMNCAECHADIHRRQLGGKCEDCHSVRGWQVSMGAVKGHQNRFPLLGAHTLVDCQSCHKDAAVSKFTGLSTECVTCHLKEYQSNGVLDHVAAHIPPTCETCHGMDTWRGARFDHARFTRFPLESAHATLECAACHAGGRFNGTQPDCLSCHARDFSATTSPNHVAAGFATQCAVCHTMTSWAGAKFDHGVRTRFTLTGAHASASCASCHAGGRFAGTAQDCATCHAVDYQATRNPDHRKANISTDCATCHSTGGWAGARFDHSLTRFPLTGAHAALDCGSCHTDGKLAAASSACISCHAADFDRVSTPNHKSAGFPHDCTLCHNTNQWKGARFDHNTGTRFTLTGGHVDVVCGDCHKGGVYKGTPDSCVSCHQADFNSTRTPNHLSAGFPRDCTVCHTTVQWKGAKFDHNTATKFPLTGVHTTVVCAECHKNEVYKGTSAACAPCHLTDFNNTKSPNHAAAGFPQDCSVCHTTVQWKGARFDHGTATKFPLTGAHTAAACADCHKNSVYRGTAADCVSCHLASLNATRDPNHVAAGFPQDCSVCHTTVQWKGAKFDHNTATVFALTGAHTAAACAGCHKNNVFKGTSSDCVSCHLTEFNGARNPNHLSAGFPQTCSACHNTAQWKGARFDHSATRFPLAGGHANLECARCHADGRYAGAPTACASCHLTDFNNTRTPNHVTAGFPQDCTVCHTTAQWKGARFDHNTATRFALAGAHVTAGCADCHKNNVYKGTSAACASCHLTVFNATTNPNHVAAGFPQDCGVCHTTVQWRGARFDHNTATRFALTGVHTTAACADCHKNNVYRGTSTGCASCHLAAFNSTTSPNHATAGFPQDCGVCHTTVQWRGARFDHNTATRFALTGAHTTAACADCHRNNVYRGTSTGCASCHLAAFNATTNPNHVAAGFPQDCSVCHTTTLWRGARFDHNAATTFPLTGVHVTTACANCHRNNVYRGTSAACASCHLAAFNATTNPNHVTAGFPQDCSVCHTTAQWRGAQFNHGTATRFPLTGAHVTAACADCHKNNVYRGTSAACASCHLTAFNDTRSPSHTAAGFPQDCSLCHTTTRWAGARFDHTAATRFPLTGAHTSVACMTCHVNNRFAGTPSQCSGCHLVNYNGTTSPNHVAAGFPQDCTLCHTTTRWQGATFDHNRTRYPLTGAHTTLSCIRCHAGNRFAGTPTQCSACHLARYQATTNPNHVAAGFPQDCSLCHTTTQWTGARFDHTTATRFPLTGLHTTVACANCHRNNQYAGLSTACASCHLARFTATTNPNHVTAGFPQDCSICHTTAGWTPASFNHSTTRFPLTGVHTTTQCVSCHIGGRFAGTPTECYSCHTTEYTGTTNPNHAAAGFPRDCSMCHTTSRWAGATFTHSRFPIYSGSHAGKWTTCGNCHTNSSNYTVFTCLTCHEHAQLSMDQHHSGVRNYVYNSANCYACHPTGRH